MTLDPLDPTFMPTTREGQLAQQIKTLQRRMAVLERKSLNGGSDPVGSMVARPTLALPPGGYLYCDGAAVSRVDYGALFALLWEEGLPFGAGNGTTTFNLPDCRGRALVAVGAHADVNAIGDNDGLPEAFRTPRHSHTIAHTHPFSGDTEGDVSPSWASVEAGTGWSSPVNWNCALNWHQHDYSGTTGAASATNSGSAHSGYLAVHYFIKA